MKVKGTWSVWLMLVVMVTFSSVSAAQAQGEENEDAQWFNVDAVNVGLGEVPEEVSRATPRESVRSFVELTEKEDFTAAAHLLNLSELSSDEQRSE
ncbi:unnamed protein product, partial [Ectocarpus sp. 12 AP-2014]